MNWDPAQYRKFAAARLRPANDLLARIDLEAPRTIVDLGCGEGAVTRVLHERWPHAELTGVDSSEAMLRVAMGELDTVRWRHGDLALWRPTRPVDLLFSNAALHWLPNHERLFLRLLEGIAIGGVLAVQMPCNFRAPSHTLIADAAMRGPWQSKLAPLLHPPPVAEPSFYYDLLAPVVRHLDIWETEYLHLLQGDHAVAEWTKGTWRKPFLDALTKTERVEFERIYRESVAAAYPPRPDGTVLFPFRRLFIVAHV